ncbi:hypothetical protein T190607A01A_30480 [Tenacibaculum sp. 190524A05c]|uniref:Uncharacterized protein n=1 Tax=Tenacibaculum platacis TaxID=3137852 RepID=A0ABM9P3N4_9FLAO
MNITRINNYQISNCSYLKTTSRLLVTTTKDSIDNSFTGVSKTNIKFLYNLSRERYLYLSLLYFLA